MKQIFILLAFLGVFSGCNYPDGQTPVQKQGSQPTGDNESHIPIDTTSLGMYLIYPDENKEPEVQKLERTMVQSVMTQAPDSKLIYAGMYKGDICNVCATMIPFIEISNLYVFQDPTCTCFRYFANFPNVINEQQKWDLEHYFDEVEFFKNCPSTVAFKSKLPKDEIAHSLILSINI